jgi:hypothetical protein
LILLRRRVRARRRCQWRLLLPRFSFFTCRLPS